jgi:hypothetical protein
MVTHACVAIGINRYQFLPPLSYGQADANALWEILVNQSKLPSDQCLLFTDTSPLVDEVSTYPTQSNILSWLEAERQNSSSSANWRWFFFSGYGVSWEGVDYLMPIDGNPDDIPGTGIPMRSLFASLKHSNSDNILVLLDINRSPGVQAGNPVGVETVELAHNMGIAVVLSSQLDEFSHEAAALGNGLFTTALLEALRYYDGDTTLENLDQYLRDRLPELSQHHWRPIQTPLIVVPSDNARQQLILPTIEHPPLNGKTATHVSSNLMPQTNVKIEDAKRENFSNGTGTPVQKTAVSTVETPANTPAIPSSSSHSDRTATRLIAMVPSSNGHSQLYAVETPLWRRLLLWGGSAVLVLLLILAAIVPRVRNGFMGKQALENPTVKTLPTMSSLPNAKASPTTAIGKPSVASAPKPVKSRLQVNQADLEQARRLIRPNQASLFNKAIFQARKVRPGDPLYKQAQQDISRWSGVILDLAEGRAAQKDFSSAIAAAQLVPKDDSSIYSKAQQGIGRWQVLTKQQQQNQGIIQAAKTQIQPNQASSYQRAIATLSKVPPAQPGYAEAQQLKEQWSRSIYLLANSRASEGQFPSAIQAAALVPAGTSSSEAAQKAIAKWKQGKR